MKKSYETPSVEYLRIDTSKPLMGSIGVSTDTDVEHEEVLSKQFGGGLLGDDDEGDVE